MSTLNWQAGLIDAIPGATARFTAAGVEIDVPCRDCGRDFVRAWHGANRMPPPKIVKILRERGWTIGNRGNKHVCPGDHEAIRRMAGPPGQKPAETERTADVNRNDLMAGSSMDARGGAGVVVERGAPGPELSPSDKAKVARRETVLLLAEVFDEKNGRYQEGESDATVGRCTGLSEEAVAKLREEFYGQLSPLIPPEVSKALSDMKEYAGQLQAMQDQVMRDLSNISKKIEATQKQVSGLIVRNGWKP